MDLFDPSDPRHVHFMGVAGTGMSALALAARNRGVNVTGCDVNPSGAPDLAAAGVNVAEGHTPDHLADARAVVATAAIPHDHAELVAARDRGIPVVARKAALAQLVAGQSVIAVAGTHGKTTTTAMTVTALDEAGLSPTGIAGGRVAEWAGNAVFGDGEWYVVEADEYDRALLELAPKIAVITNIEPEHLECYGDERGLVDAFATFAARAEVVLLSAEDRGSSALKGSLGTRVITFGVTEGEVRARGLQAPPAGTAFTAIFPDGREVAVALSLPGRHNVANALAALGASWAIGADIERAAAGLSKFSGVGRRFERLGEAGGIEFVDDYAHHPSEISAALAAGLQAFPDRRLVAVFQPHLYSRTQREGAAMGAALAGAGLAVVTDVYPAREQPIPGVSGEMVARAARDAGVETEYVPELDAVPAKLGTLLKPGDVVLTLGAGTITNVGRNLVRRWPAA